MWNMPIEMLPMAVGVVLTAVVSYFFGFSKGVIWGVAAFFLIQPLIIMVARARGGLEMSDRLPPTLAPIGCLFLIGSLYLFLRLWLWAPEELWFGQAYPFLGAFGTGILFVALPCLVQTVMLTLLGSSPNSLIPEGHMRWGEDTPLTTVAVVIVFTAIAWAAHTYGGGVVALGAGLLAGMTWVGALPHKTGVGLRLLGILAGYGLIGVFVRNWWVGNDLPWTVTYLWSGAIFVSLLLLARRAPDEADIPTRVAGSHGAATLSSHNPRLSESASKQPHSIRTDSPAPPQRPERRMPSRQVDPANQGMVSALLEGSMKTTDLEELMDLVRTMLERNVPNPEVLYELARESHPDVPTWEEILDLMDDEESRSSPVRPESDHSVAAPRPMSHGVPESFVATPATQDSGRRRLSPTELQAMADKLRRDTERPFLSPSERRELLALYLSERVRRRPLSYQPTSPSGLPEDDQPDRTPDPQSTEQPKRPRGLIVIQGQNPASPTSGRSQAAEIHIYRRDPCILLHPHDSGGLSFLNRVQEVMPFLSPTPPFVANGYEDFPSAWLIACDEDIDLLLGYARDAGVTVVDGPSRTCRLFSVKAEAPMPPRPSEQKVSPRQIDPGNQGLASGLLDGAMRSGSLEELMDLVELLQERNVKNLPVLYTLAQKRYPDVPTWDDLLDRMADEE